MKKYLSKFLDGVSEFLAHNKGLLPLLGIIFIVVNFLINLFSGQNWINQTDVFLHVGIILSVIGIMLSWAL